MSEKQVLKMNMELMDLVENGSKVATTRLGFKTKYTLGDVVFQNNEVKDDLLDIGAYIYKIEAIDFCEIDDKLAEIENYKSAKGLKDKLIEIYGRITEHEQVTVIYWDR